MITRRTFAKNLGFTLGASYALPDFWLSQASIGGQSNYLRYRQQAKSVIFLYMFGGPSQVDTFDWKPELAKSHGKSISTDVEFFNDRCGHLLKSPYSFKQYGQSGAWVSELFPNLAQHVDDIAYIKSCVTSSNNHAPAALALNTGSSRIGYPSVGAWVNFAFRGEIEKLDLPGYVVMLDPRGAPINELQNWGSGFLPGQYQGTKVLNGDEPILNLAPQFYTSQSEIDQRMALTLAHSRSFSTKYPGFDGASARIESLKLADRMSKAAELALSLDRESDRTKEMYGINNQTTQAYGRQLLLARRLVERGVRFVMPISGGGTAKSNNWDSHDVLAEQKLRASETDKPIAGLITDLKQRGLLDQTLIVWSGEFGRTPMAEKSSGGRIGRDHNPTGYTAWMAGGGIKGGVSYGSTDELGLKAATNIVTMPDFHATILHQLGIEHTELVYSHSGRQFRLTDVSGNPVSDIISSLKIAAL